MVLIQFHCMNDHPSLSSSPSKHQKTSSEMKWRYVFAEPAHVGRTEPRVFSWFLKVKPFWIVFNTWGLVNTKTFPISTMMLLYHWTSHLKWLHSWDILLPHPWKCSRAGWMSLSLPTHGRGLELEWSLRSLTNLSPMMLCTYVVISYPYIWKKRYHCFNFIPIYLKSNTAIAVSS